MAKNRTMQAKNARAKKLRGQEIRERSLMQMAHEPVTEKKKETELKQDSVFGLQRRINVFMGKTYYNIIRFQKRYPEIYDFILCHTYPETKTRFQMEFDLIRQGLL